MYAYNRISLMVVGLLLVGTQVARSQTSLPLRQEQTDRVVNLQSLPLSLDISPDSQYIVVGEESGRVSLWDAQTGLRCWLFEDRLGPVTAVKYVTRNDTLYVLTGSYDNSMRWIRALDGQEMTRLRMGYSKDYTDMKYIPGRGSAKILSMDITPSGLGIATVCSDKFLYKWSVTSRTRLDRLDLMTNRFNGSLVAISPDGKYIIGGYGINLPRLKVWRGVDFILVLTFYYPRHDGSRYQYNDSGLFSALAIRPMADVDVLQVMIGTGDGRMGLWLVNTKGPDEYLEPNRQVIKVPSGWYTKGSIGYKNRPKPTGKKTRKLTAEEIKYAVQRNIGELLVEYYPEGLTNAHQNMVTAAAFSVDGRYLVSGSGCFWPRSVLSSRYRRDGYPVPEDLLRASHISLWHVDSGQQLAQFSDGATSVFAVKIAPNGQYIASVHGDLVRQDDQTIRRGCAWKVWDLSDGLGKAAIELVATHSEDVLKE